MCVKQSVLCSVFCAACDYGTNSGFYLISHLKEMGAVVFKFVNGFVNVG
jgi:hypothetical protein